MISFYNGKTAIEENTHHLSQLKRAGIFLYFIYGIAGKPESREAER